MKVRVSYIKPSKTGTEVADKMESVANHMASKLKDKYVSMSQLQEIARRLKEWANATKP